MREITKGSTIVQSPKDYVTDDRPSIFLAGGITGWRQTMINKLSGVDVVLLNPRVQTWPTSEAGIRQQLAWEHLYLREANLRMFWFAGETVCPMTLFELGIAIAEGWPLVVGADPKYAKCGELKLRCVLASPTLRIADSLEQLTGQAIASLKLDGANS